MTRWRIRHLELTLARLHARRDMPLHTRLRLVNGAPFRTRARTTVLLQRTSHTYTLCTVSGAIAGGVIGAAAFMASFFVGYRYLKYRKASYIEAKVTKLRKKVSLLLYLLLLSGKVSLFERHVHSGFTP